jgi:FAD/FMN-containing dehydrogenase
MVVHSPHLAGFSGEVVTRDHPGYDDARSHFDRRIDRRPELILRCQTSQDVAAAVRFARDRGLEIAVRSGGHSVPGYSVIDGAAMIDLRQMRRARIDVGRRVARVQPGVTAGNLARLLQPDALVAVAGFEADPGFVGLAIHGGRGILGRRHAWASDHIRSAQLVTAEGEQIVVSRDRHQDLLYGLRGAGSNFGIVTELEVDVHPVPPEILGGSLLYGPDELPTIVPALLRMLDGEVSDDMDVVLTFFVDGGAAYLDVVVVHIGPPDTARREIDELRTFCRPVQDQVRTMGYADLLWSIEHPPLDRFHWAEQGSDLGADDLAVSLLALVGRLPGAVAGQLPNHYLVVEPFGRGFERAPADPTPVPRRTGHSIAFFGAWTEPARDDAMRDWARRGAEQIEQEGVGNGVPVLNYNTETGPESVARAYGENAYRRLQELKRRYDPTNAFRWNHNVRPD